MQRLLLIVRLRNETFSFGGYIASDTVH